MQQKEVKMAHITNKLRGLVAAFVAVFAALALVPGTAFADFEMFTQTGSITINSTSDHTIGDQNTFTVKKVADVKRDTITNETDVVAVETSLQSAVDAWVGANNAQNAQTVANGAASLAALTEVEDGAVAGTSYTVEDTDSGVILTPFTPGIYFIQIANTQTDTFQNIIASVGIDVDNEGSWVAVDEEVDVKASSPDDFQKNVVDPDNPSDVIDEDGAISAAPGETFTFKVSFKLNSNMSSYQISDSMTNMEFDSETGVKMYTSAGAEVTSGWEMDAPAVAGTAFSLTIADPATMIANNSGATEYYILYKATVVDTGTVEEGASNAARDNQQGSDEIDVRFAGLKIFKVDSKSYNSDSYDADKMEDATLLDGAKFTLYRESNNSNGLQTGEGGDAVVTDKISTVGGVWSTEDNNILLDPDATYYLVETAAPNGYVLPDNTTVATLTASNNNLVADNVFNLVLKNDKGDKDQGIGLPETGGMGTVALTAAGVVLVAGAAAFIVRSRKQN